MATCCDLRASGSKPSDIAITDLPAGGCAAAGLQGHLQVVSVDPTD
jgi:hypothetical protein